MVTWFDWRCKDSPTRAHHFVKVDSVGTGDVFRCLYCLRHKWYPTQWGTVDKFSALSNKYGIEEAYNIILSRYPAAKRLMTKLEDLWYVRKEVTDDETFVEIVSAVMKDKGYRKEEPND